MRLIFSELTPRSWKILPLRWRSRFSACMNDPQHSLQLSAVEEILRRVQFAESRRRAKRSEPRDAAPALPRVSRSRKAWHLLNSLKIEVQAEQEKKKKGNGRCLTTGRHGSIDITPLHIYFTTKKKYWDDQVFAFRILLFLVSFFFRRGVLGERCPARGNL